MPFVPSYTATQVYTTPSVITLTDTSTGADALIAERRVVVQDYKGAYLQETGQTANYKVWALASSTVTLNVLLKDTAVKITVTYVKTDGTVLYTAIKYKCCDINTQIGKYNVQQKQVADPSYFNEQNYIAGLRKLNVLMDSAQSAVVVASDLYLSQSALNGAKLMLANQKRYF